MSMIEMMDEDEESALYIDETSQISEDMRINEDDDIEEEDMNFTEEEENGGFPESDQESQYEKPMEEFIQEKVLIRKIPATKLPPGTSIKKIPSASDPTPVLLTSSPAIQSVSNIGIHNPGNVKKTTVNITSNQLIKLPNPNIVSIKEVPKEMKVVPPKGLNFTLISKKSVPTSKGEFVPILPKLIPAPCSLITTITSSGIGPLRTEPPKIIKVNTSEPGYRSFIGTTVITQKPLPQLQPNHQNIAKVVPVSVSHATPTNTKPQLQQPQKEQQFTAKVMHPNPEPSTKVIVSKETPIPTTTTLTMSPRSQQRSKSLTLTASSNSQENKRKLSVSSLEASKPYPLLLQRANSQTSKAAPSDAEDDDDDDVQIIEQINEAEIIESDDNEDTENIKEPNPIDIPIPVKVSLTSVHQESPARLLKWDSQIGNLPKCRFKFELNEFGLLEIMEKGIHRNRLDIGYEKPLFERQASASTKENEPLYYCVGCHCKGAAVDFLGPVFCSVECLKRASKRRSSSLKSKIIKSNRREIVTNSLKRLVTPALNQKKTEYLKKTEFTSRIFNWRNYINQSNSEAAPIELFKHPFPPGPNRFEVGMKLEAIDPENNSKFCVCTVVQVLGYRIKLHFDKFSRVHDFWVNADSVNIFPPGWCLKTNRLLQPPRGFSTKFSWQQYLDSSQGIAAPRSLFAHLYTGCSTNQFKIGMKLEADDVKNTNKICVATVADVIDDRILVHFDGWDECYDYWIEIDSPFIHPINYHKKCGENEIIGPPGWESPFRWSDYLLLTNSQAAQESYFSTRKPIRFQNGMKLEVVDRKNPTLIRPASVVHTNNFNIKVLFDGWSPSYSYWVRDDSRDIHPIGWAENTGHSLEPPPSFSQLPQLLPCVTIGCRGIGNVLKPELESHANSESCPYFMKNWNAPPIRINRFDELDKKSEENRTTVSVNKRKQKQEEVLDVMDIQIKQEHVSDEEENDMDLDVNENVDFEEETKQENGVKSPIEIDESIAVAKQFLYNYGPRLRQNYELFCKNLNFLLPTELIPKTNPMLWDVDDTYNFLSKISSLSKAAELLKEEEIDGESFLSMRKDDFMSIFNLPLGTASKVYALIVRLRCHVFKHFRGSLY